MFPTVGNCPGPWNPCSPIFSNLASLTDHCVGALLYIQKEVFSSDCHISARQRYAGIQPSLLVAGREPKADPLWTLSHRNGDLIWYWNIFAQRMNSSMFWNTSWTSKHCSANASGKETWDFSWVGSSIRRRSIAALLPASITQWESTSFRQPHTHVGFGSSSNGNRSLPEKSQFVSYVDTYHSFSRILSF